MPEDRYGVCNNILNFLLKKVRTDVQVFFFLDTNNIILISGASSSDGYQYESKI